METLTYTKAEIIDYCINITVGLEDEPEIKEGFIKRLNLISFSTIIEGLEKKGCKVIKVSNSHYSFNLTDNDKKELNNVKISNKVIKNKSKEYGYYTLPIGD